MNVKEAVNKRRSLRNLNKISINNEIIRELAESAMLAPSCFNNQPWKFVFIYDETKLEEMKRVYSKGNEWANDASMVIVIVSREADDCVIGKRTYYQFDTGLAVGQMLLRAVELGLSTHLIAGYSPSKTKKVLNIPDEMEVIALMIVGGFADAKQKDSGNKDDGESMRPTRKPIKEFTYLDNWGSSV